LCDVVQQQSVNLRVDMAVNFLQIESFS